MLRKVGLALIATMLVSSPAPAAIGSEDALPQAKNLASLMVEVDPASGVSYSDLVSGGGAFEKSYGECSGDITLDMPPLCPTCNNCPAPDPDYVNEIVVICVQYHGTMVLPTVGQEYGFDVANVQLGGSAKSYTYEVLCPQAAPGSAYEFLDRRHCAIVFNVEVDSCSTFTLFFDLMGTLP